MKITHAADTEIVQLADLADGTTVAACSDCHSQIDVGLDDYGYWVVCDCTVGYVDDKSIRATVMW